MKIVLTSTEAADSLSAYLQRCGCIVGRAGARAIEASAPPRSLEADLARLEVEAYLRVWRELNPGAEFTVVPATESESAAH